MFSKFAFIASLAVLAVATPTPGGSEPASQCDTGALECCQSVQPASDAGVASILTSLGIVLQDPSTPVGLTCSPITLVGVGSGASCNASPVCCNNNNFNGVVAIGCTPVNLSL